MERISVKSSLSYNYSPSDEKFYLKFNLSSKPGELIDLNIQVMFWLSPWNEPRTTVPSLSHMGIVGWYRYSGGTGVSSYGNGEGRNHVNIPLLNRKPMRKFEEVLHK